MQERTEDKCHMEKVAEQDSKMLVPYFRKKYNCQERDDKFIYDHVYVACFAAYNEFSMRPHMLSFNRLEQWITDNGNGHMLNNKRQRITVGSAGTDNSNSPGDPNNAIQQRAVSPDQDPTHPSSNISDHNRTMIETFAHPMQEITNQSRELGVDERKPAPTYPPSNISDTNRTMIEQPPHPSHKILNQSVVPRQLGVDERKPPPTYPSRDIPNHNINMMGPPPHWVQTITNQSVAVR